MLTVDVSHLEAIARGWREAPQYTRQALEAAMDTAVRAVRDTLVDETLPNASGDLHQSVLDEIHTTPAGVLGVVGSASPVAAFVELGTRPHMPPIAALQPWVSEVLGIREPKQNRRVAYLVARKIARVGTPAQRPFARALEMAQPQIARAFEDAVAQIADYLAAGGATA